MSDAPPQVYGATRLGLPKKLGERLRELWEPHEYVRIMNIDDETFYWQALAPQDETYEIDRGPTRVVHRRPPRQYMIKSGESAPLEGWNAYLAVEQLYKKILAKSQTRNRGTRKEIIFNWEDPNGWEVYLPRIYMGKEVPTFSGQEAAVPVKTVDNPFVATMTADEATANAEVRKPTRGESVADLAKELGVELA